MMGSFEKSTLAVESIVTVKGESKRLTGAFSEDAHGWIWDKSRLPSIHDIASSFDSYVDDRVQILEEGTRLGDWQSGVVSGIELLSFNDTNQNGLGLWGLVYSTGAYSTYRYVSNLYSDYSTITKLTDRTIQLDSSVQENSVSVNLFQRLSRYEKIPYKSYSRVSQFTGRYENGERLDAYLGDEVLWDNLDTVRLEFTLDANELKFNQVVEVPVGQIEESELPDAIQQLLESHGQANSGRLLYTRYFPLKENSAKVFLRKGDSSIVKLTRVDNVDLISDPDLACYEIDEDLGIIKLGGYELDSLVLSEDTGILDNQLYIYPDQDAFDLYPDQGIIRIGTEEILYREKNALGFTSLVRGYNSTTPQAHTVGDKICFDARGKVYDLNDRVYLSYVAVPRIEYETIPEAIRTANNSSGLNIKPSNNAQANGVVQISTVDKHVNRLTLETSLELVGGNLFGPMHYGTDVAKLIATAYDSNDNPVSNVWVTIQIESGAGLLTSGTKTISGYTNSAGQLITFLNAPLDDSIYSIATKTEHVGSGTQLTVPGLPQDLLLNDVYVYQILKYDKYLGTIGDLFEIKDIAGAGPPYGEAKFFVSGLNHLDYEDGFAYLIDSSGTKHFRRLGKVFFDSFSGESGAWVYTKDPVPATIGAGNSVRLFTKDDLEYDSEKLNGRKVILYAWDTNAEHPLTGEAGAYMPVTPDIKSGNKIVFSNRILPIPDPEDDSVNLAGYAIVSSSISIVGAKCINPANGSELFSDNIRLLVQLPNYLKGVDRNRALPIPYGFTFLNDEHNIGTGLGGANFITINPRAEGINQFSIYMES